MISTKKWMIQVMNSISNMQNNTYEIMNNLNGMWLAKIYNNGGVAVSTYPTPTDLATLQPMMELVMSLNKLTYGSSAYPYPPWGLNVYFTAYFRSYVYVEVEGDYSVTVNHDDHASIYVNDTLVSTIASTTITTINLPLVEGWNKVECIVTQNTGNSSFWLTNNLESMTNIKYVLPFPLIDERSTLGEAVPISGIAEKLSWLLNRTDFTSSEQQIGTWLGLPLYRKTISVNFTDTDTIFPHGIENVNHIWIDNGHTFFIQNGVTSSFFEGEISSGSLVSQTIKCIHSVGDTNFTIQGCQGAGSGTAYITFNYTKTTDIIVEPLEGEVL